MWPCKMRKVIFRHVVEYAKVHSLLFACEKQMAVQFNFVIESVLEGRLRSFSIWIKREILQVQRIKQKGKWKAAQKT